MEGVFEMFAHDNCLHPWTAITSPPPSTRSTPLGHTDRPGENSEAVEATIRVEASML